MIAVACIVSAVVFAGMFWIAGAAFSTVVSLVVGRVPTVRFFVRDHLIDSMTCRQVARYLESDLLD